MNGVPNKDHSGFADPDTNAVGVLAIWLTRWSL